MINKDKQIEEMAKEIEALYHCKGYVDDRGCYFANSCTSCKTANREKAMKIAEALYNEGCRKQSEWISVEERLPEDSARVLVYGENGIVCATHFKGDWWLSNRYEGQITHWMPLPEAPKMKGGE